MLGTPYKLPQLRIGHGQRKIKHCNESKLIRWSIASASDASTGSHHGIILTPKIILTEVSFRIDVLLLQTSHVSRMVVSILSIELITQSLQSIIAIIAVDCCVCRMFT